jgi:cell division protein FtsB
VTEPDTRDGATQPPALRTRQRRRRLAHLLILSFAAIMLIDALVGDQGAVALSRARQEYRRMAAQVERLKSENALRQQQNQRLREDQGALEEAARRDLGLMKPGEKVFIIKDLRSPSQP